MKILLTYILSYRDNNNKKKKSTPKGHRIILRTLVPNVHGRDFYVITDLTPMQLSLMYMILVSVFVYTCFWILWSDLPTWDAVILTSLLRIFAGFVVTPKCDAFES